MKRVISVLLLVGVSLAAPSLALAGGQGPDTGHYSDGSFHWAQAYVGWGPACKYGQDVWVVYDATNTWSYLVQDGDVRETLVQNGTARIYDITGLTLLDERSFHVTERFFDAGGDVARIGESPPGTVWYQVSHRWDDPNLEEYQYIWKIPGVYDYRAWNRAGEAGSGWTSGGCEGGDGWPLHPLHPFSD